MVDINMKHMHSAGDETAWYSVELNKECTVDEFICEVLIKRPNEWGSFSIKSDQIKNGYGSPSCTYKRGVLESHISKYYSEQTIKEIHANGGWGFMEYIITLK